jgi:hypothetical protein
MEVCFDNSGRLARTRYLFEYRGVRFKLIQDNPRRYADHLLTIVPSSNSPEAGHAFLAACEFVSALAWANRARVAVWEAGGMSWPDAVPVERARPHFFQFPHIAFGGHSVGYDTARIPRVQTETQRIALGLFREASASNNHYLAFLFYWQVLEVDGGNPVGYVTKTLRRHRSRLALSSDFSNLPLGRRPLGNYLLDDCRNAIAHIRRQPGRKTLDVDVREERGRLARSTGVIRVFAEDYIRYRLGLNSSLHLVRSRRGGFPVYLDEETIASGQFKRAYPPPRLNPTLWGEAPAKRRSQG